MHAAWFERHGSADVLQVGDLPKPTPGPGQVLVRLEASGVNPSDVKKRAGPSPGLLDDGYVIPHSDGAGAIVAVGEGVDSSRIGERVWVYQAQYERRFGTAAQYVAIESSRAASLPMAVSYAEGACLGIPAMTAHRCVFADGSVEAQSVLVTGGAGRVGWYAIQWARMAGARVIATASNAEDRRACLELGAHTVVNHREAGWGKAVVDANDGRRVDRVIEVEFGANLPEVLECVRTGGTIASYASVQVAEPAIPFRRMMFMDLTLRMVIVYAMPETAKRHAIRDIRAALMSASLKHRIARTFALSEVAAAHRQVEDFSTRGCVVVVID